MTINQAKAVLFFVFVLFSAAATATAQSVDSPDLKAQEILKKARAAVSKKADLATAKSFTLSYEATARFAYGNKTFESGAKTEVNLSGFDKIRASKSIQHFADDKPINNEKQEFVLNGGGFFFDTKVFGANGEKINFDIKREVDKLQRKRDFRYEIFHLFFPLSLEASWYFPMSFKYVGAAESKDGKAEVLETIAPNKTTYRLFFDAKTNLLLMMTESWTSAENKSSENRYFYSDYQEKDGLLAATRIVVERNGKATEEKTIKNIKINPTFKPDFFEVK